MVLTGFQKTLGLFALSACVSSCQASQGDDTIVLDEEYSMVSDQSFLDNFIARVRERAYTINDWPVLSLNDRAVLERFISPGEITSQGSLCPPQIPYLLNIPQDMEIGNLVDILRRCRAEEGSLPSEASDLSPSLPLRMGRGVHIGNGLVITAAHTTIVAVDPYLYHSVAVPTTTSPQQLEYAVLGYSKISDIALLKVFSVPDERTYPLIPIASCSDIQHSSPDYFIDQMRGEVSDDLLETINRGRPSRISVSLGEYEEERIPWYDKITMKRRIYTGPLPMLPGDSGLPVFDGSYNLTGIVSEKAFGGEEGALIVHACAIHDLILQYLTVTPSH